MSCESLFASIDINLSNVVYFASHSISEHVYSICSSEGIFNISLSTTTPLKRRQQQRRPVRDTISATLG